MALIEQDIRIDIDLSAIVPPPKDPVPKGEKPRRKPSGQSIAVGTISYPKTHEWPEGEEGVLFYIKASVTDDVPAHVANYATEHDAFPHESTLDQFFDDNQFESYRALGAYIGGQAAEILPLPKIAGKAR